MLNSTRVGQPRLYQINVLVDPLHVGLISFKHIHVPAVEHLASNNYRRL